MQETRRYESIGKTNPLVQNAYNAALVLTVIALPFSNFLMSQGAFLMLTAWALDRWKNGPLFRNRGRDFWRSQTTFWAIIGLFCWLLLGQLWTIDLSNGWSALRIKLPLLAFPLVLISGRWDIERGMHIVRSTLAISIISACAAALWAGYQHDENIHAREWSPFISHIRFSLMIAFAWAWWLLTFIRNRTLISGIIWLTISILGGWVIWKTAAITGLLMIPFTGACVLWIHSSSEKHSHARWIRIGLRSTGLLAVIFLLFGLFGLAPAPPQSEEMREKTIHGEVYQHFPKRCLRENGSPVWINIAWGELQSSWNSVSEFPFTGNDGRQQELKMTLIRFLASKGFTKDAEGVLALSQREIKWIESGIPTILELEHSGLLRRWDIIQFEIANGFDGGDPSGHSLVQRFSFLNAAMYIYRFNPIIGVGTGDLNRAFASAYEAIDSSLQLPFRLRAHNQYVTFLLSGGPIALILWLTILASFYFSIQSLPDRGAALLFLLIISLSCLTEDTLETQAGVTFTGFFMGLFGRKIGRFQKQSEADER
jgi:hypothetical protein